MSWRAASEVAAVDSNMGSVRIHILDPDERIHATDVPIVATDQSGDIEGEDHIDLELVDEEVCQFRLAFGKSDCFDFERDWKFYQTASWIGDGNEIHIFPFQLDLAGAHGASDMVTNHHTGLLEPSVELLRVPHTSARH